MTETTETYPKPQEPTDDSRSMRRSFVRRVLIVIGLVVLVRADSIGFVARLGNFSARFRRFAAGDFLTQLERFFDPPYAALGDVVGCDCFAGNHRANRARRVAFVRFDAAAV